MVTIENYEFKNLDGKNIDINKTFCLTRGNLTIWGLTLKKLFYRTSSTDKWLNLAIIKLSDKVYSIYTNGKGALKNNELNIVKEKSKNGEFICIMLKK